MPNLHSIERRINSVQSTRKITSTMQMIAATKVSRTARRLEASKPYYASLSRIMQNLISGGEEVKGLFNDPHRDCKNTLIVCIVSDKGLAGGFNSNIFKLVAEILKDNKKANKNTQIIACGTKAVTYLNFRDIHPVMEFNGVSDNPTFKQAVKIADFAIEKYLAKEIDDVVLIYNACKNSMEQTPTKKCVLPVNPTELVVGDDGLVVDNSHSEMLYIPGRTEILDNLFPLLIRTEIFNALLDSAAGEQVARRIAMQNATDSADDMIETLTRLYNSVRQGAITTEINEIVGGAEAQKDN